MGKTASEIMGDIAGKSLADLSEADVLGAIAALNKRKDEVKDEISIIDPQLQKIKPRMVAVKTWMQHTAVEGWNGGTWDAPLNPKRGNTKSKRDNENQNREWWTSAAQEYSDLSVKKSTLENNKKSLQTEQTEIPVNLSVLNSAHAQIQQTKQEGITTEQRNLSAQGLTRESVLQGALTDSALKLSDKLVDVNNQERANKTKMALLIAGGLTAVLLIGYAVFLQLKKKK